MVRADLLRMWALLLAAILTAGFLILTTFATGAEAQEAGCRRQVVLDAGHGGYDSGAVDARHGLKEKEQTLDVARRLEVPPEADGHAVCMTRTGGKTLSNNDRYANTTGAEVLVSVASGVLLKSDMSETVFTASDAEGCLLSDGTGAPAADSGGFENRDLGLPVHPLTGRFPVAPASPNPTRRRPSKT